MSKKLPKLPIIAFHIAWKHDLPQHQVNSRVFLVGDTLTTTQTLEYECCHDMGATDHVCPKLMIKTLLLLLPSFKRHVKINKLIGIFLYNVASVFEKEPPDCWQLALEIFAPTFLFELLSSVLKSCFLRKIL